MLISAPRLNSEYVATGAAASKIGIRNKSANLYIKSIKVQVNNAQGHLDKAGGTNEAFITSERLFEMTRENAGSHYFKEGGFREWRDKQMCVLLSSQQFAPGLMVSDGVAYPINVDVTLELQNRHVDVSALDAFGAFSRAEVSAMAALVEYLELTQKGKLPLLRPPKKLLLKPRLRKKPRPRMEHPKQSSLNSPFPNIKNEAPLNRLGGAFVYTVIVKAIGRWHEHPSSHGHFLSSCTR